MGFLAVYAVDGKVFHGSSFLEFFNSLGKHTVIHINQTDKKGKIGSGTEIVIDAQQIQSFLIPF